MVIFCNKGSTWMTYRWEFQTPSVLWGDLCDYPFFSLFHLCPPSSERGLVTEWRMTIDRSGLQPAESRDAILFSNAYKKKPPVCLYPI
jgi:hypothetical protein